MLPVPYTYTSNNGDKIELVFGCSVSDLRDHVEVKKRIIGMRWRRYLYL